MRIFTRILNHLGWQWSYSPISQLVLLVNQDLTVVLQEVAKTELLQAEFPGCLSSIEHVHNVEAKVTLQPHDITIGSMQHLDDLWIVENSTKSISK